MIYIATEASRDLIEIMKFVSDDKAKREENLSRTWSWSIMADIFSLSSPWRESKSPKMFLSIIDLSSET